MLFKKKSPRTDRVDFPTGIVVKTETGYWYINGNTRKPIPNTRVLKTWSFPIVVEYTEHSLSSFKKGSPLGFRPGSLIRDISDGKIYLIEKGLRRLVVSPESLTLLNKKRSDALWVSHNEVLLHKEGEDF